MLLDEFVTSVTMEKEAIEKKAAQIKVQALVLVLALALALALASGASKPGAPHLRRG